MRNRWFHAPELHVAHRDPEKKVSWLELFYDLIFVAAFIQLGNTLAEDVSLKGGLVFGVTFVPLWLVWTGFSFFQNRYTIDDFSHRTLVLLQMFCVAAIGLFATQVAAGNSDAFALSVGAGHELVALMYLRAYIQMAEGRAYAGFWGSVFALGGALWLGSAMTPEHLRHWMWGAAALCVLSAPLTRFSRELAERFPVDWEHLSERYGLLTLIVLGESFVKVLSALVSEQAGFALLASGGLALLLTCGVWWIYFDDIAGSRIRVSSGQWIVWLYSHVPLQIGIVALAVGIKKALHFHLDEPAPEAYRWTLAGSLALVYFAVAAIDSVTERRQAELSDRSRINARWLSGLLLLVLAAAGNSVNGLVFVLLVTAVNVSQVFFDLLIAPYDAHEALARRAIPTAQLRSASADGKGPAPVTAQRFSDSSRALRKGAPSSTRSDLYSYFLKGSWTRVFVMFGFMFLVSNVFFAGLYVLEPHGIVNAHDDNLLDAFFFSVQTMSTIGYGAMSPVSTYANTVATAEAVFGLVGVAIVTGLIFAKLSRPRSSVMFSKVAVIAPFHGKPTLTFRMGNAQGNEIVDASVKLMVLKDEISPEGTHLRRFYDLQLERGNNPFFALGWTVMHVIDEKSPLADVDLEAISTTMGSISVTMTGHDGTYGATTFARHIYQPTDIRVGHRFVDIMSQLDDGRLMIDYEKFHDTVALATPAPAS